MILFKAKRTIVESEENKNRFHVLIDEFSTEMVEEIKHTSGVPTVQKAFDYFEDKESVEVLLKVGKIIIINRSCQRIKTIY